MKNPLPLFVQAHRELSIVLLFPRQLFHLPFPSLYVLYPNVL